MSTEVGWHFVTLVGFPTVQLATGTASSFAATQVIFVNGDAVPATFEQTGGTATLVGPV